MTNEQDALARVATPEPATADRATASMNEPQSRPAPEPTPTPWRLETLSGRIPAVRETKMPHGEASTYRATVKAGSEMVCRLDFGYGKRVDTVNAELIVRAVNSHQELLDALKLSLDWLASYPGGGATKAWERARTVIAKATGDRL